MNRSIVLAFVAVLALAREARAEPLDELTISLLTFGPGDHPFTKFGHNGLLVENAATRTSLVYNYGTFSFDSVWLLPKFLLGKYRYWLSIQTLERTLALYAADNRSVTMQGLHLTADQKRTAAAFLEWNSKDENKYYVFDYYRDNCATRIRDLLDRTIGGALSHATTMPAQTTWRGHTQRLTADDLPVYSGLYVAMGGLIDRPITAWQEMFLPSKLEEQVRRVVVESPDGAAPLVDFETSLVQDHRPPLRSDPPAWTGRALLVGTTGGLLLTALGWAAAHGRRAARIALGTLVAALGLKLGLLGCLFVFLWAFTNHEVAYANENILACAPFAIFLLGAGIGIARASPRAADRAHRLALATWALAMLGLALKLLPWFSQDNGQVIALVLPLWAGAAGATLLVSRAARS